MGGAVSLVVSSGDFSREHYRAVEGRVKVQTGVDKRVRVEGTGTAGS